MITQDIINRVKAAPGPGSMITGRLPGSVYGEGESSSSRAQSPELNRFSQSTSSVNYLGDGNLNGMVVNAYIHGLINKTELETIMSEGGASYDRSNPQIDYGQGKQSLTDEQQQKLASGVPLGTIISSQIPRDQYEQNAALLQGGGTIAPQSSTGGSSYAGTSIVDFLKSTGQQSDYASREKLAQQAGIQNYTGSAEQNTQLLNQLKGGQGGGGQGVIQAQSNNQTFNGIVAQANEVINQFLQTGGTLDATSQKLINQINGVSTKQQQAILEGQNAVQNNDVQGVNQAAATVQQFEQEKQQAVNQLQESLQPLREQYLKTLQKSGTEQDLETQLADLRTSAEKSNIRTESQPIPMTFIVGQNREQMKIYQAEEANLLAKLGLAQENRQAEQKGLEVEMGFISDDFELQQQIEEKVYEREQDVLTQADKLDEKARQKLSDILSLMEGVDPDRLSPQEKTQLAQVAASAGLDIGLVLKGMDAVYTQQAFDNSLQASRESRLGGGAGGEDEFNEQATFSSVIKINQDKTDSELRSWAKTNTDMKDSDIDDLLATRLAPEDLSAVIPALIANQFETFFFAGGESEVTHAKQKAKNFVLSGGAGSGGVLTVGKKSVNLNDPNVQAVLIQGIDKVSISKNDIEEMLK